MANYKQAYLAYMNREGIKYVDRDERSVSVTYTGENLQSIKVIVIFDKDGENLVHFVCWSIGGVKEDKYAQSLICCNELNSRYRWVKFYIDKDNDVAADMDAYIDIDTVGPECAQLVRRMVGIVDDAYLEFMKIKLGM